MTRKLTFLRNTFPSFYAELDPALNVGLDLYSLTTYSNKTVWWKCSSCSYSWKTFVYNRTRSSSGGKCPTCSGRVVSDKHNLFVDRPDLMADWDYNLNTIDPHFLNRGASYRACWKCSICGYKWKAYVSNRNAGTGCPECSKNKAIDIKRSLFHLYPVIASEWDYNKNDLLPEEVSYRSGRKFWWKCKKCNNSWKAVVSGRTDLRKSGCPYCANVQVSKENSLQFRYKELAKEWSINKNSIAADKVAPNSGIRRWWLCSVCSYEWAASPHNRVSHGSGCPKCAKSPVSKVSQLWLDSLNIKPEFREYKIDFKNSYFKVDGFDPETNTVYEFLGDYWHGNPAKYKPEDINSVNKESYGKLYNDWLDRKNLLESKGYKVVYIWESDFIKTI